MPGQRRIVTDLSSIADLTIMSDVHIAQQSVVITDHRTAAALRRPSVNSSISADLIVITDHHRGGLADIFQILINFTDGRTLSNAIIAANAGMAVDHAM